MIFKDFQNFLAVQRSLKYKCSTYSTKLVMSGQANIPQPSLKYLQSTNARSNLSCNEDAPREFLSLIEKNADDLKLIESLQLPDHHVKCKRKFTYIKPENNNHNAWYVRCNIQHKKDGKLSEKRIAIKDNTAAAFIPLMNGSSVMEGYTPEYDATVVSRILEEGGIIVGKTTCESLCFSGDSFQTKYGPIRNPCNRDYTAGGSSSGSAVVVALDEVDMAIGKKEKRIFSNFMKKENIHVSTK